MVSLLCLAMSSLYAIRMTFEIAGLDAPLPVQPSSVPDLQLLFASHKSDEQLTRLVEFGWSKNSKTRTAFRDIAPQISKAWEDEQQL